MTKKLKLAHSKVKDYCVEVIGKPEEESNIRLEIEKPEIRGELYNNFITWLTDNYEER